LRGPAPEGRARVFLVFGLVALVVVGALAIELSANIRRGIQRSMVRGKADRVELEFRSTLRRLFEPLEANLRITRRWGEQGALDLGDQRALNSLFIPILEQYPFVASMRIANERGSEYLLLHDGEGWVTRSVDIVSSPGRIGWQRWTPEIAAADYGSETSAYDPRKTPWYETALADTGRNHGEVRWTRPYPFSTTGEVGFTLVKRWARSGADSTGYVAGFDVPLASILAVIDSLVQADDGRAFLMSANDRVFAGRTDAVESAAEPGTRGADGFESRAISAWQAVGRTFGSPSFFVSEGEAWWVDFRPVWRDSTPPWLALAVPVSSLTAETRAQQHKYAAMLIAVFVMGSLLTIVASRYASRRSERAFPPDLASEEALRDLIGRGEGDQLEFKSTLRWNLAANKPGKEVELAWLKTVAAFLNSEGGILAIGVNDRGEVAGIDADGFPNDDKFLLHFNNVFNEHLGPQARPFVEASIRTMGDKKVFLVVCRSSLEPVFLTQAKDERFYVRMGPSSRQLPTSEVVRRFRKK
jgi:hypothetical protein